ncbi:MAG: hypothetical protein K5863_06620 [Nitratireductor sp.]|nr:hypothetical protein [Nitratireductor sp.]
MFKISDLACGFLPLWKNAHDTRTAIAIIIQDLTRVLVFLGEREKRRKPNITSNKFRRDLSDLAVIGCSALERDDDLLEFDIQEVSVSDEILDQSRKTFLTADHTKSSLRAIPGPR